MNLTKEQLDELEEMAFLLLTPEQCAINLEMPEMDFLTELHTVGSPLRRAYYRGHLRQIMLTRRAIVTAAHNGSHPAQVELLRLTRNAIQSISDV